MVYKTQISGKNKTITMLINKNIGQVIESMLDYGTFCKKEEPVWYQNECNSLYSSVSSLYLDVQVETLLHKQ